MLEILTTSKSKINAINLPLFVPFSINHRLEKSHPDSAAALSSE